MLYETIKHLAKSKKFLSTKLKKKLNISQGSICKWNKVKPSYDKICGVAKILNVPIEDIVKTKNTPE